MSETITFTVNGNKRTATVDPELRLLDVIRDELHLTGTKRGCDNYTCGTCVVVVNGKAVKSCAYPLTRLEGAEVLTVEGLAEGTELHPIQQALIDAGAVQCGFCTPGIIMELYALFTENLDATEEQILSALDKHLCRCTGYEAIWEGALLAQERLKSKV
jgi:aerobic-type carbon monoxide dehydrogenase small subunit (CoxS/CutS family)